MKTFKEWKRWFLEYRGMMETDIKGIPHDPEKCYDAGAEEKEKEMLEFIKWRDHCDFINMSPGKSVEYDLEEWKQTVRGKK